MFYFVLVLVLMNVFSTIEDAHKSTALKSQRKKPYAALVFSSTSNLIPSDKNLCQWLRRHKMQNKMCLERRGLPEILLQAKYLATSHCQSEFEYEQWNCSRPEFFFKKMYRETALMYSMASSAIMFSLAKACAQGTLSGCTCGKFGQRRKPPCSVNTKFAKKFTRKFLQLRKKGDGINAIVKYNSEIGIKVVLQHEKILCKCHGVSGTCPLKVCWKEIRNFTDISKQLRSLYHSAIQVKPGNDIRNFKTSRKNQKLLYLDDSPSFCTKTVGRYCTNADNCATVCCGKDPYTTPVTVVNKKCKCRWRQEIFNATCDTCLEKKILLQCS